MVRNLNFVKYCPETKVIDDAQESLFQAAKRSKMYSAIMKGLWFPYNQESCFIAWKRSYMRFLSLLCRRFSDSQESRFQASKRSNKYSAVMESVRSSDIH